MLNEAAVGASHCHCMFPGGTRDVLRKGAIPPSTHTPLAPQSPKPTSFSSCVSPAGVVVLVTKQTRAASQLWIKMHWAKKPGYFHPEWIPILVLYLVLAEGRERVRAGSREEGKHSLWPLSWLVPAEGAHGRGRCPGWSQQTQPLQGIQKAPVSPSWLSVPQLCHTAFSRDFCWSSM